MPSQVRVGGGSIGLEDAKSFARTYLNDKSRAWSYPAYDGYPGGPTRLLSEQDLFGAVLLNVPHLSLRTYYALVGAMDELNAALVNIPDDLSLVDATPGQLELVADLFGILDPPRPHGVKLTKLSKILHRKRPGAIPLFDTNIGVCYKELGNPPPVPHVDTRSYVDFTRAWLPAVRADLTSQIHVWEEIVEMAPGPLITPLRALDIVGWHLGASAGRVSGGPVEAANIEQELDDLH